MRIIGHIDLDAFFASVEERDNPQFRGLPIVVGADPKGGQGRGVVSTANYKAREYFIRSALPITKAWQLSEMARKQGKPGAIFLPANGGRYSEVSERIMAIIRKHIPLTEQASIDEAYLDLSFVSSYGKAKELTQKIKQEIKEKEQLTASIGIGQNKLIAKIASDKQKPDGLTIVLPEEVENFLGPLSIREIPGVGPKTEITLNHLGIKIVSDLWSFSEQQLIEKFGKWGRALYQKCRGVDNTLVLEEYEVKSIGEEETFEQDTQDPISVIKRLTALCEKIIKRLPLAGFKTFRTLAIKIRFNDFSTKTRAYTLQKPAVSLGTVKREALRLIMPFFDKRDNPLGKKIRLIGVRVEKLD